MPLLVRYKKVLTLLVAVVLLSTLMSVTAKGRDNLSRIEGVVVDALTPVQSMVTKASAKVSDFFSSIWKLRYVYQENASLREQIAALKEENNALKEVNAENERLRASLDYKKTATQFDLVTAGVVGRDPSNWDSLILIDKGSRDGLQKDMPVVTREGLVGYISDITPNSAKVTLITDSKGRAVGGIVQRSRVTGIVEGVIQQVGFIRMVHLPVDSDVRKGDLIITSGFGGIFPKGLVIGEVTGVVNEEGGLMKYAEIKPAVDLSKLEEVLVIKAARPVPEPAPPAATPPAKEGTR